MFGNFQAIGLFAGFAFGFTTLSVSICNWSFTNLKSIVPICLGFTCTLVRFIVSFWAELYVILAFLSAFVASRVRLVFYLIPTCFGDFWVHFTSIVALKINSNTPLSIAYCMFTPVVRINMIRYYHDDSVLSTSGICNWQNRWSWKNRLWPGHFFPSMFLPLIERGKVKTVSVQRQKSIY